MKHLFNLLFNPDPANQNAGGGAGTSPPAASASPPATPAATPPAKVEEKPSEDPLSKAMDNLLDKDDKRQEDRREAIKGVDKSKEQKEQAKKEASAEKKEEAKTAAEVKPEVKIPEVKPEEKKADLDTLISKLSQVIDQKAQPAEKKEEVQAPAPMKFYEATDAEVDALIEGGQPAKDVLTNLYKKAVIDAVTIVNTWAEQAIKPIQTAHQTQQVEAAKGRFFTKYPDLKPVENLALEVADKLVAQVNAGQRPRFKSEEELFVTVNEITSNYIKGVRANAPAPGATDGGGATGVTKVETTDKGPSAKGPSSNGGARSKEGERAPKSEDESLGNELLKERY